MAFASSNEQLYAAFYRDGQGNTGHVTAGGQVFLASEGLMDDMLAAMRTRHPEVHFHKEKVDAREDD